MGGGEENTVVVAGRHGGEAWLAAAVEGDGGDRGRCRSRGLRCKAELCFSIESECACLCVCVGERERERERAYLVIFFRKRC